MIAFITSMIKIHSMVECSEVNGPGKRAVIWFQGCDLSCTGCWNPLTHAFNDDQFSSTHGVLLHAEQIITFIMNAYRTHKIEGVTFSGGEPMQQPDGLTSLIYTLQKRLPWLSRGMFTGYTLKELNSGKYKSLAKHGFLGSEYKKNRYQNSWRWTKNRLDWAIMGRYNQLQPASPDRMITSENQELHLFTDRYLVKDFPLRTMEVTISPEALVTITGFPTNGTVDGACTI